MRLAWLFLLAGCGAWGTADWSQHRRLAGPFGLPRGEASDWGPAIHAGPDNSALLVWVQENLATSGWEVFAARWGRTGWAAPDRVGGGGGPLPLAGRPVAALDHAGHALVAWSDTAAVWVARQVEAGEDWEAPVRLASPAGAAVTLPALRWSPDGRMLLVWGWSAPALAKVIGRWHHPLRGWEKDETLATAALAVHAPAVAFGPTGKAAVAWVVEGGRRDSLAMRWELSPAGWGPEITVPSDTEPPDPYRDACCWSFRGLRMALPAPGTPLLVWEGRFRGAVDVVVPSLWSARLEEGEWLAERLDPGPAGRHLRALSPPALALAPDGSAVVVWAEAAAATNAGLAPAEVWGRHLTAEGGWGPASRLAILAEMSLDGPLGARVAAAAPRANEAVALWARREQMGWDLASSRWRAGVGWHLADLLAGPSRERLAAPALAAAGDTLLAAWLVGSEEGGWRLVAARRKAP